MENEIKIGEYCRTKDGLIAKLIEPQVYEINDRECIEFLEDIVKHSLNIKDILEKGDLIYTDYGLVWYDYKEVDTIVVYNGEAYIEVDEREIHKIYTKEMMESISYKVKE